jgi:hypothetical protein
LEDTIHGKGVFGSVDERWDYGLKVQEKPGEVEAWIRAYSIFVGMGDLG